MENFLNEDFKNKYTNHNLNQKNIIYNDNSNINITSNPLKYIYDEEFISSINGLSNSIKNYYQNKKLYLGNIKLITENINEQTYFSKSAINDIAVFFNQMDKSKYNMNISLSINEKYIKDKMKLINEKIEKIDLLKNGMLQNIKNCEIAFFSFYEEAKNLFKKMKIIRTEKIENLNKKILVNRKMNYNNNISLNNNNHLPVNKRNKTISHSPSHKINNTNKSNLIQKRNNNKSNNLITNLKYSSLSNYNDNNNSNPNIKEITNLKIKYIELLEENKKLKEDLSKIKKKNCSRKKKKINTISRSTSSKKKSSASKRCTSTIKKNYTQKPLSNGNLDKNKSKKFKKPICHSRNQTQTQILITNTLSSLADDDNNKLIKSIGRKSELIPCCSTNNILLTSKNSVDIGMITGLGIGGTCRNNIINNFNNNSLNNNLASMVLSFLKEMKKLQENITKKVDNVKDLKKKFELQKKELKKYSESILEKNFSLTYAGNKFKNLNTDSSKDKIKEQNVKEIMEMYYIKDNNNNNNDIIKEYEMKNNEQNNIIQNKEKEIEKLNKEIIDKTTKIEEIEKELKSKEDKIKTEKEISNLKEEKLNSEKEINNKMSEEITELKNKNKKIESELKEAKNNINNLQKINNQLNDIKIQQNKKIDDLNQKSTLNSNNYNSLNEELEKKDNENTVLKNEILQLKEQLTQCNNNFALMVNTNESIINEKENIIKNIKNKNEDLNKQIDSLNKEISKNNNNLNNNTILNEEINILKKNNDDNQKKILELEKDKKQLKNKLAEIKSNYISHNEEFKNIKTILTELNEQTEIELKKLSENEKKFEKYTGTQNQDIKNGMEIKNNEISNISIEDWIKDTMNNLGEYKLLLDGIKDNNNFLNQINNN